MRTLLFLTTFLFLSLGSFSQTVEDAATLIDKGEYAKAVEILDAYILKHPKDIKAYLNRGVAHIRTEDLDKAIDDFSVCIKQNDKDPDFYNKRGYCYMNFQQKNLAILDFEKAIALDPYYYNAYENLAIIATDDKNYKSAIEWYTKSLKANPAAYFSMANRGNCYRLMGDKGNARADFNAAIAIEPKYVEAYQYLAQLYQDEGDTEKTLETVLKCIEVDPDNSINVINASNMYFEKGDLKTAKAYAEKAKQINPRNPDSDEYLVMIAYSEKKYDEALNIASELVKQNKAGAKTYNVLGLYYWENTNNHDTAVTFFKTAIDKDKFYVYPYKNLSDIFAAYKMADDALEGYTLALKLSPRDAHLFNKRGLVYFEQKQNLLFAANEFESAMLLEPNNAEFKNNYGRVFISSDPDKALGIFDEVIKLNPSYWSAYYNKSVIYIKKAMYTEAIDALSIMIKGNPLLTDAYFLRGYCYTILEKYKEAKADFEKHITLDDKNSMAFNNLGFCFAALKDDKNAEINYTKAIELDAKNSMAYYGRGKVYLNRKKKAEACSDLKTATDLGNKDAEELMKEKCK